MLKIGACAAAVGFHSRSNDYSCLLSNKGCFQHQTSHQAPGNRWQCTLMTDTIANGCTEMGISSLKHGSAMFTGHSLLYFGALLLAQVCPGVLWEVLKLIKGASIQEVIGGSANCIFVGAAWADVCQVLVRLQATCCSLSWPVHTHDMSSWHYS